MYKNKYNSAKFFFCTWREIIIPRWLAIDHRRRQAAHGHVSLAGARSSTLFLANVVSGAEFVYLLCGCQTVANCRLIQSNKIPSCRIRASCRIAASFAVVVQTSSTPSRDSYKHKKICTELSSVVLFSGSKCFFNSKWTNKWYCYHYKCTSVTF